MDNIISIYDNGGSVIPKRYSKLGFTKVGEKKKSTRPEKKWMVLAKKGDKYKVVHGGYKGMEDYTQHKDKERRKRFWQRMGGFNSKKAKDSFSPLYWHKKFGTWENGGVLPENTIKVIWTDTENPEIMESKMFDSISLAKEYAEQNKDRYLIMELEEQNNGYYKWSLLPYGDYKKYKTAMSLSNLFVFKDGGSVKLSRLNRIEVKRKAEQIGEKINKINTIIRWHEGKDNVKYKVTNTEKMLLEQLLIKLRSNRGKIFSLYLKMKDEGQKTIASSSTEFDIPNKELFNLVLANVEMKYIVNYAELNKTQRVDNLFYTPSQLKSFEDIIKTYQKDIEKDSKEDVEIKKQDEMKLSEIEIKAIQELIALDKFRKLTQEEAEYLYNSFKDYEKLNNEDGSYIAPVKFAYDGTNFEETKEADEQLKEFVEMLDHKRFVFFDEYESNIESYPITIDLVNAIKGRVFSLTNIQSGSDLFQSQEENDNVDEAIKYLSEELKSDPNNEEIKEALEYLKSELGNRFDDGGAVYKDGGKIEFDKFKLPSLRIYNYAKKIKKEHPEIWKKGGNVFGNQAFKNLERVIKRGYWLDSEKWMFIKWRSFVARHKHNFRIEGVVAMLKWIDEVDKGFEYMKDLIEETIHDKKNKMSDGGELTSDILTVDAVTDAGLKFDFDVNKDLTLDEVINLAKEKSAPQNLISFNFKGTKYTINDGK